MSRIQQRINEIEAQEKELANEKMRLLEESREADLVDVRAKCVLHGFTATDLKGAIKMRGRGRPPATAKPKRDANAPKRKYTRRAKPAA